MINNYNDEQLLNNYTEIARAYSKSLKNRGFIFIRLEEEECNLLIKEILIIISKMLSCLERLNKNIDSKMLKEKLLKSKLVLCEKFNKKEPPSFNFLKNESTAFLNLISLENTLIIKLMLLSIKSGEIELCNSIITNIASIFSESFSYDEFKIKSF